MRLPNDPDIWLLPTHGRKPQKSRGRLAKTQNYKRQNTASLRQNLVGVYGLLVQVLQEIAAFRGSGVSGGVG
jgi:hypothetical protein